MNVFDLRQRLIEDYAEYTRSFLDIADPRIRGLVDQHLADGLLWPHPLIQLNPAFEPGGTIDRLVEQGALHAECRRIFRRDKREADPVGRELHLHRHQTEAIGVAATGRPYVLTTGTGSGKSLAYIVPIVDHVLRRGAGQGIQAIVVYPMNALANSQHGELTKFLGLGYPAGHEPVRFARYTGQEDDAARRKIIENPPDILLTNYVMLELILTRTDERQLVERARGLRFLVLDELHTYRGRQGADVAMLMRRCREAFEAPHCQFVGTSATLGGEGTWEDRRARIADVTSRIFGAPVRADDVIGETLRRVTPERATTDRAFIDALREQLTAAAEPPRAFAEFVAAPLASWLESTFGVRRDAAGRLERQRPRSIDGPDGAAAELAALTGVDAAVCADAIRRWLLGSYEAERHPETGFPIFAFRVHQFLGRGDTVYASLEPEDARHVTVHAQQFVPGDRSRVLFPLIFCRECGQEYYSATLVKEDDGRLLIPRPLVDFSDIEGGEAGYVYLSTAAPWPAELTEIIARLPDDWIEDDGGTPRIRRDRRDELPQLLRATSDGHVVNGGSTVHWVGQPFRFCLRCGVSYAFTQKTDFGKLTGLGTGGRTMATTLLSLSTVRGLRGQRLPAKLLSFTDNRQDASLQSGHLNDFVQVVMLRAALYRACLEAGAEGLTHDVLRQRVFDALALPFDAYAKQPDIEFGREDVYRALRDVLAYRLYQDLKHGWRITSPNLEQCGLLEIRYRELDAIAAATSLWQGRHPLLLAAPVGTRVRLLRVLLDFMRRGLALDVDVLRRETFEQIQQRSQQDLVAPWALDEQELPDRARTLYVTPTGVGRPDVPEALWLSPRGAFGQYLRRALAGGGALPIGDREAICGQLLEILQRGNLVQGMPPAHGRPGYQLKASGMRWCAGDGTRAFHDPLRMPNLPEGGGRANPFFGRVYRELVEHYRGIEAREHTAQVPAADRQRREQEFREARLPVLFCSPTMELGVDIAELSVVNMRNVPPTPANYAQRSGRAGRSGQPALVFTYCTSGSPHDQYFFSRPEQMVAGQVLPPRLDLANEDLVRAHVHAVWLAESGMSLGSSLTDVLDMSGDPPSLALQPSVQAALTDVRAAERARARAERILAGMHGELAGADWWTPAWLDQVLARIPLAFEQACTRWRTLYRAAHRQREVQHQIVGDHTRSQMERDQARRLRQEAESQIDLLTKTENVVQSDFYSYRYFASEGFLPGYNFPRLPLSAYIPGRRTRAGRDEFVTRPRFLAISEFGPRAIIYHEGSRYRIHRVILPIPEHPTDEPVALTRAKVCVECGYLHPIPGAAGPDRCERCEALLPAARANLFRLQNVSTRRRDKITCDEEERLRLGYLLRTGVRFAEHDGTRAFRTANVREGDRELVRLSYGPAATLWRFNLGWRRSRQETGFDLDVERGAWGSNRQDPDDQDGGNDLGHRVARVVPYVEDRRNCLLVEPVEPWPGALMASLQAALKAAIQSCYQLEDAELAAEPLPDSDNRRVILLYESAEGGAGVLRRLIDDPQAIREVARAALGLGHFDPDTGADLGHGPRTPEPCEAACYACLMSYGNQPDHRLLDRQQVRDTLLRLAQATVVASPTAAPRAQHLAGLKAQCQSDLERQWLDAADAGGYRLPSHAQRLIAQCGTRPDFLYEDHFTVIYVDGPHHEYPDRQQRDRDKQACLEDAGWTVLRFSARSEWEPVFRAHADVFGPGRAE